MAQMAQHGIAAGGAPSRLLLSLLLPALASLLAQPSSATSFQPVRVAFLTDCAKYSNWQSLAMIFSFRMSGQPGKLTRVMCCSEADAKSYTPSLLHEVETHIAPSYSVHPRTGDSYVAYNKPEAIIHWLEHVTPEEEYVLVLDSDMILRRPFLVEEMQPKPGLAIGNRYDYMIGVSNDLAMRHVPEVKPRNDTLAGPVGRRGDQVGGFFFIHRADLKRMSHGWLKYTEDVRADPLAYRDTGDSYAVKPGDKPWISEMYGYSFGAATADVWHKYDSTSMIYPYGKYDYRDRGPKTMPKLMHYGLLFEVNQYKFDKHWFYGLDVTWCPDWDTTPALKQAKKSGLFDHPPRISELKDKSYLPTYYRDLLVIETVATMNAGMCDYHLRHCPPSQQLLDECSKAWEIYIEVANECRVVEEKLTCSNEHVKCEQWAQDGECRTNARYMQDWCRKACNACSETRLGAGLKPQGADLERNLAAMAENLKAKSEEARHKIAQQKVALPVASPRVQSSKARQELLLRCYRLGLSPEDLKQCVQDAKDGFEFAHASMPRRALTDNSLGSHTADERLLHDADDLSLHTNSSAKQPQSTKTDLLPVSAARVGAWQLVGLGVLLGGVLGAVTPRVCQRRAKMRLHWRKAQ